MPRERLVVVSYPADEDYARINAHMLAGEAAVAFLRQVPEPASLTLVGIAVASLMWWRRRAT